MSDLDIVIKLDPQQPVTGAKAVTAEVAKLETQATKSAGAIKHITDEAKKYTDGAASGIAKMNFKQAAAGVSQAFGLINEKLKITDSEFGKLAESAVKFGAMGAQVAGPWGAVAGALLGVALEGEGTFEMLERIADSTKTADERIAQLIKGSSTMEGQLKAITQGAHSMSEGIVLVTAHLQRLHDGLAMFESLGPVLAQVNAQLDAQKRILGEIDAPLAKYTTDTTALHMLWKTGAIDAIEYTHRTAGITAALASADPAMAAMTAQHAAGTAAAKAHADELKRYAEAVRDANRPQITGDETIDAISGGTRPKEELTAQWKVSEVDVHSMKPLEMQDVNGASGSLADMQKQTSDDSMEQWRKNMEERERSIEKLAQHMKPLEDFFVTAATTGKLEWKAMIDAMIADLIRLAAKKAVLAIAGAMFGDGGGGIGDAGKIANAAKAQGYAAGGTIWPTGGGTADTQHIAFRKRPDETVHINTPQQEQAYQQRSGQGGGRSQRVDVQADDSKALLQNFDGPDGDRVLINVIRRNPGAIRALLAR